VVGQSEAIYETWLVAANKMDLADHLATALSSDRVRDSLDELAPGHPQYKGLQAALQTGADEPDGACRWNPDEPGAVAVDAARAGRPLRPRERPRTRCR